MRDDEYVVNAAKTFITGGLLADLVIGECPSATQRRYTPEKQSACADRIPLAGSSVKNARQRRSQL
jgi:hypothetical protein